jgi:hypothetical protein
MEIDQTYHRDRDIRIGALAAQLCKVFEPWARSRSDARLQSMVSIMQRASEMGVMLFSQSTYFEWQWSAPVRAGRQQGSQPAVVTLPGLYKITDARAMPLPAPIPIIEPKIARDDGH